MITSACKFYPGFFSPSIYSGCLGWLKGNKCVVLESLNGLTEFSVSRKIHLLIWQDSYISWGLEYCSHHFKTTQSWGKGFRRSTDMSVHLEHLWISDWKKHPDGVYLACPYLSRRKRDSWLISLVYALRTLQRRTTTTSLPASVLGTTSSYSSLVQQKLAAYSYPLGQKKN